MSIKNPQSSFSALETVTLFSDQPSSEETRSETSWGLHLASQDPPQREVRSSKGLSGAAQKYLPAHCWCLESHQEMCSWLKMVPLLRLFLAFT